MLFFVMTIAFGCSASSSHHVGSSVHSSEESALGFSQRPSSQERNSSTEGDVTEKIDTYVNDLWGAYQKHNISKMNTLLYAAQEERLLTSVLTSFKKMRDERIL